MKLILLNGYPYPYPTHLPESEQEDLSDAASGNTLEIRGVVHFEWLHTVTIEFDYYDARDYAQSRTGWKDWGAGNRILEAQTSGPDGYDHPAIIAGNMAYCGFILKEDD